MFRTVLATAVVALALSAPAPVPASAATPVTGPDPLAGLTEHPEWGSITGQPGVLLKGCHSYDFSYAITPPAGTWALEIFINGPQEPNLANGAFLDGYDPLTGTGHYTLCRNTTRAGTFTIRAKLSVDDGYGHITDGKLPDSTYVLRKQKRRHHHHHGQHHHHH